MTIASTFASALLLASVALGAGPWTQASSAQGAAAPGELIVRFARDAGAAERAEARSVAGVEFEGRLPVRGAELQLVTAEPGSRTGAAERALERADAVVYAEPNYLRRAYVRPNDPSFGLQWGFENTGQSGGVPRADIGAVGAWDLSTGSPSTVVAVIDSGVSLGHPDLSAALWGNPGETSNALDDDANGLVDDVRGWDWVGQDALPSDEEGHGTHVAGTIGARTGNGIGVAGTSWNTRLMALRVLDAQGNGTVADVIRAYRYAAAEGAQIVNASLGSAAPSLAERDAIAAASGVLFVTAAGNGGADGVGDNNDLTPEYPCAYPLPNVVCVASSDRRDQLSAFSNYGASSVDLAAPGQSILSTGLNSGYRYLSGTSMATPHVAGAAGLLLAARPALDPASLRSALLNGVTRLPSLSGRVASGGRLDARRSLELAGLMPALQPPGPAPPSAPVSSAPPPPSLSADRDAPRLMLRVARRQRLLRALRRGVPVSFACDERCSVRLRLLVGPRQARRIGLTSRWRSVSIAALQVDGTSGKRVTLRLTRRARARLRSVRATSAAVDASARDVSGNSSSARRTIALKR